MRSILLTISVCLFTGCGEDSPPSSIDASTSTASAQAVIQYRERWSAITRGTTERSISYDGGDFLHSTAPDAFVTFPVNNLTVGEQLAKLSLMIKGTGAPQQVAGHLLRSNGDGTSTVLHSVIANDPPPTWQAHSITWSPAAIDVIESGKAYYWYIGIPAPGTFIGQTGYFVIE